ncbi:PIR Superfamily Protein [Plasmodium ovale curtisi]|uniref:PIR Superfamily Protein n=1 Tax=Plasmodium ovale curtisi TaxID=864141 RepID=A0A1A8XAH0_PLAOA|nr:PIR Superfamily Protein [Plasmodium ovale curtisi]
MDSTAPDIYSFFKVFKTYKSYEGYMETDFKSDRHRNIFNYFSPDIKISGIETANEICEKFKRLYKLIISINKKSGYEKLYDIDFAFLNYWLNSKLRNATISNKLTIQDIITKMENREEEFIYNAFNRNIYNIKYEDFNNMALLSNLYYNHSKIFQSTRGIGGKIQCLQYFHEFIDEYKKGIIMCPYDDTSFCKALKHYKDEYEQTFLGDFSVSEHCIDRERLHLPTYNDVSPEDRKNIIVGSVLGSSFGTLFTLLFLYKIIPLERWIRDKIGINNEAHSNLYEEHDQSFLDTSYNGYIDSNYNTYHMSYDSVAN